VYTVLNAEKISTVSSLTFGPRAEQCAFWNHFIPQLAQVVEEDFCPDSVKGVEDFTREFGE